MKRVWQSMLGIILAVGFSAPSSFSADTATAQIADSNALVGKPAPDFSLKDTQGKQHALKDYKGKLVVLEWVNFDCPFVKKHYSSNNMQNLQKAYTGKGVVWLSINSSAPGKQGNYAADKINEMIKERNATPTAYLLDADGTVGRAYGARTTPDMYVIDPAGVLIYAGAIDNRPSTDAEDIKGSQNYVKATLDQALKGKKAKLLSTKAYGCSVKY
jgi:peroxiredoxin